MRRDLKLNMSALLWIASRVKGQAEALGELEAASADFLRALKGQDGLAYERLSAEWEENIGRRGKELGNRLEEIAAMVEGYVRDMESLVSPLDEWAPMQVDRDDIWFNYRQIAKKAADFGGILSDTGSTAVDYAGHFVYNLYDSREENEARKARMEEEERKEKARRERNYGKLSGFRALLGEAEAGIHREVEGIGEIYRNHVEPFEDMDDEYGKRMGECYERWSSYWNIVEDRWEMLSETAEGMWDGGKDFVKGVYSMAEGLGAAYTYGKLTGLGLDRLGLVPPELEEKAGKMREGAAAVLRDPGNVLEAVGQEMADRADEKGAAYMAGYVAADIAIGVMLDKGIGKIRGMGKADDAVDVGREASRHADDVAEGLAGKADEIGEAAGCLDDLARGIGEGGTDALDIRNINGQRTSRYRQLSDDEISQLLDDIEALEADSSIFRFNEGNQTGFLDSEGIINVRGDVLPDLNSNHPRDLMSPRAVLAHEYYGHKHFDDVFGVRNPLPGSWNDEFRASYNAALNAPNLSDMDRMYLMLDALERAKEAGVNITITDEIRRILYGY